MGISLLFVHLIFIPIQVRLSFLKQRSNRRFNYTPRYFKGKKDANPYDFGSAFEQYRDTPNTNDFGAHWREARRASRTRGNRSFSPLLLIIIALLSLAALFVLDFDLSIF
ncbi:MAG: hypothetical protein VWZ86_01285 [Flavobacteriaceae bacterium]